MSLIEYYDLIKDCDIKDVRYGMTKRQAVFYSFCLLFLICGSALAEPYVKSDFLSQGTLKSYFSKTELLFEIRLLIALGLGMLCGLSHGLGNTSIAISTKTFGAVSLGAAAFAAVMTHVYLSTGNSHVTSGLGNVVTGIGFVCAAVIFKQGSMVKGLSTAASLWTCSAIGMACGTAMFGVAFVVTLILCCFHFIPSRVIDAKDDSNKL